MQRLSSPAFASLIPPPRKGVFLGASTGALRAPSRLILQQRDIPKQCFGVHFSPFLSFLVSQNLILILSFANEKQFQVSPSTFCDRAIRFHWRTVNTQAWIKPFLTAHPAISLYRGAQMGSLSDSYTCPLFLNCWFSFFNVSKNSLIEMWNAVVNGFLDRFEP